MAVLCCGIGGIIAATSDKKPATTAGATQGAQAVAATTAAATAPQTPVASPSPPPAPKQLLTLSGNGIKKSALFDTPAEWSLTYTFDCTKFAGGTGNFQVFEYTNGNLHDVLVNELSAKGGDTIPQHGDRGQHYLEMNSECSWTVTVNG